tara:strand:+ start:1301 stop:1708 length:408 start_codon:yes stop_codon:yes gene_type:complete
MASISTISLSTSSDQYGKRCSAFKKSVSRSANRVTERKDNFAFLYSITDAENKKKVFACDGVLTLNTDINKTNLQKNREMIQSLSSYWTPLDGKHVDVIGRGDVGVGVMYWIPLIESFRTAGATSVSYEFLDETN